MTVTIYQYGGEYSRLDKSAFLYGARVISDVSIKGMFRADAPELYLNYDGELDGYNYIKVDIDQYTTFYYFATFSADLGQTVRATCTRDPLMSFKSQLVNTDILVDRCTKQAQTGDPAGYNSLVPDPRIRLSAQGYYREFALTGISFAYPSGYGTAVPQYVLGVIG